MGPLEWEVRETGGGKRDILGRKCWPQPPQRERKRAREMRKQQSNDIAKNAMRLSFPTVFP